VLGGSIYTSEDTRCTPTARIPPRTREKTRQSLLHSRNVDDSRSPHDHLRDLAVADRARHVL